VQKKTRKVYCLKNLLWVVESRSREREAKKNAFKREFIERLKTRMGWWKNKGAKKCSGTDRSD